MRATSWNSDNTAKYERHSLAKAVPKKYSTFVVIRAQK